ncbi:tRNA (adenosine(37)-N6)-threonylcarbamoyltransferase complex ATPase subunit type 1 TsaE [Roseibium sp. RKSG952]|uniref:tRNA (adenosine(37)-N6)-threonylcarbamoyltransferase complex ATPase subunit type 1 TsaE n=1 Tax=Roseibium sp. RKSG952 TaxID=2529384 RepID=UPI001AD8E07D|nr:tRNA (adenosine(37)-N6)-threonylcarbamoyltransferase complex ATPase subunit type 1 TsaE [Roseibium sp. RKSG952]
MSELTLQGLEGVFAVKTLLNEAETVQLAEDIGMILKPGDLVALSGDLGAGKSTFARALIKNLAGDEDLEVPSPTFTLVQNYDLPHLPVAHFDLYRLEEPEELDELGLNELLETGAALVEWPEQAGHLFPQEALWIQLTEVGEGREARFASADPAWSGRIARTLEIRSFLNRSASAGSSRTYLAGDASTRRYERIKSDEQNLILMDWPEPEGTAGSGAALAYNRKVYRASDVTSVIAVTSCLQNLGMPVPATIAADRGHGFVLQEDFGDERIAIGGEPVAERYEAAAILLAELHAQGAAERQILLPEGGVYDLPVYSRDALLQEARLFLDWYVPETMAHEPSQDEHQQFMTLMNSALNVANKSEQGLVLRDYHSPNILWREDNQGALRLGLIDYQDAMIGPLAYDLGSLLYDARATVDRALEKQLEETYLETRMAHQPGFDVIGFRDALAVMAAQRIFKILGLFYRLARRDGKLAYLAHVPRMQAYLDRVLDAPVLRDIKDWICALRR